MKNGMYTWERATEVLIFCFITHVDIGCPISGFPLNTNCSKSCNQPLSNTSLSSEPKWSKVNSDHLMRTSSQMEKLKFLHFPFPAGLIISDLHRLPDSQSFLRNTNHRKISISTP